MAKRRNRKTSISSDSDVSEYDQKTQEESENTNQKCKGPETTADNTNKKNKVSEKSINISDENPQQQNRDKNGSTNDSQEPSSKSIEPDKDMQEAGHFKNNDQIGEGSEKILNEKQKQDENGSESNGKMILNEIDGTLIDAPEDSLEEIYAEPAETPKPTLRLVPLAKLMNPTLLINPLNASKRLTANKSSPRQRKNASYIEISSDEDEPVQISLSSSDSNSTSDTSKAISIKSLPKKASTNKNHRTVKLSNDTSNTLSLNELETVKRAKPLSINLVKMSSNVNKLMRTYRISEDKERNSLPKIEPCSETEDFENMISTSKINKTKVDLEEEKRKKKSLEPETSHKRSKAFDIDESQLARATRKTTKSIITNEGSVSENETRIRSVRKSARNVKLKTKTAIESDGKSSSNNSIREDDYETSASLKSSHKQPETKKENRHTRNKKRAVSAASESDSTEEYQDTVEKSRNSKKRPKELNPIPEIDDEDSNKQLSERKKNKKEPIRDDHTQSKPTSKRLRKESSSEEERKPATKITRSNRLNATNQNSIRSTRSQKESARVPDARKASSLKGKRNKEATSSASERVDGLQENDTAYEIAKLKRSEESSGSGDESLMQPVKLGPKLSKLLSTSSPSESEQETSSNEKQVNKIDAKKPEASDSETEIPEEEKTPILEEKFRKRNKFDENSAFTALKQKIEQRKNKVPNSKPPSRISKRIQRNVENDKNSQNSSERRESSETDKTVRSDAGTDDSEVESTVNF